MDLTVLTSHMKCGKVKRQLTALTSLLAYVEENLLDIFTSFDLVSSIIDNGICADNAVVRARSFRLIRHIYKVRIIRWDEVRNAISSELSSPDSEESLVEVFRLLLELPPVELVLLLTSEEILSSLKLLSILPNEFIKLRLCSVRYIADILLRVWLHLEVDIHLEGIRQYESLAESKRAKEDTQDLIKEFFKGFALGVVGKSIVAEKEGKPTEPLIDIQAMTSACSYAVSTVLRSYNSRIAAIAPYVRASVGLASNINKHPLQREEASCLLPLVQHFLPTLLEDFSLLVSRNGNFSSSRELSKLVYNLVLLVVKNMPYRGSSLIPIDPLKSSSSFLFGPVQSQNSTADSRIDPSFNTVLSMTEEWIRFSILDPNEFVNLHGLDFVETSFVLVEILSDDRLEHMRGLVLFPLLDGILATLERTVPDCSLFIELIALGIYCIHMVPHSDINSDVASSEETKLDIHCTVDDNTIADYLSSFLEYASRLDINLDVVRTRICALLAAETFWTHSRISHVTVRSLLSSAAVKTILVKSMPENTIKQRLCTALCRVVNKEIRKIFSDSLDSSTGFEAILLCSVEIFKTFQRCLHWPTNGMQGDSCQLEFIEMARLLAHSFTFPANSSLYTTIYHEFLSSLDEIVMYLSRDNILPRTVMEKVYSFFAEYSLRLSAGGPHFNLGKASDCLLNFFRTELLIDTKFIPSGSERLTGLVWRSIPLESSASVVSTQSSATENILRALNVVDVLCDHYTELLGEVYAILERFRVSRWNELSTNRTLNIDQLLDTHSYFPTKLVNSSVVIEKFLLVFRKVSALQLKHNIFSKTKIENSKDIVETERDMRGSFMYTYDSTTTLGPVKLPSNSVLEEEYIKQAHLILDRDGISPLLHTVEMESDCCTDFGAFSRLYTSCSAKAASKICSADTLALIDDAIMSVTNRVQKQQDIASFTSKYYASSECLFSNDRIQWRRLTGSSEIIVALGFIEMEPSKLEGVVHIRIINASGFKIPEFNLHMTSSSGASLSPFQNYTASGAEYFLPDAIVDRTFRFNISSFEPTNLVLRIIFPGLVKDPLDHAPMYQMSASSKDGRRDKQELFSAAISCIPITLPAHALLQPYGASSLFSVRQLYEPLSPLMPYDIWTAAWARLQKSVGVEVVSFIEIPSSGSFSEALVHTLKKRQKLYLSGSFDINMDTLVNNSEFSGETESRSTICWLFQSLWGHEIAVRMQLYRQSAPVRERGTWKGLIDLRGDNMDVLNALENDIERF